MAISILHIILNWNTEFKNYRINYYTIIEKKAKTTSVEIDGRIIEFDDLYKKAEITQERIK